MLQWASVLPNWKGSTAHPPGAEEGGSHQRNPVLRPHQPLVFLLGQASPAADTGEQEPDSSGAAGSSHHGSVAAQQRFSRWWIVTSLYLPNEIALL